MASLTGITDVDGAADAPIDPRSPRAPVYIPLPSDEVAEVAGGCGAGCTWTAVRWIGRARRWRHSAKPTTRFSSTQS